MSRNFEPAFVGHPGVDPLTSTRRSRSPVHANVMLPPGMEYRIKFKDGTKSNWMPVSRGAMSMPPAADLIELRRKREMMQSDTAQSEANTKARAFKFVFDMADKIIAVLATSDRELSAHEVRDAIGCWATSTIRAGLDELERRGTVQSSLVPRSKLPDLTIRMYAMRQQQLVAAE